jgi:hypothetical protein
MVQVGRGLEAGGVRRPPSSSRGGTRGIVAGRVAVGGHTSVRRLWRRIVWGGINTCWGKEKEERMCMCVCVDTEADFWDSLVDMFDGGLENTFSRNAMSESSLKGFWLFRWGGAYFFHLFPIWIWMSLFSDKCWFLSRVVYKRYLTTPSIYLADLI